MNFSAILAFLSAVEQALQQLPSAIEIVEGLWQAAAAAFASMTPVQAQASLHAQVAKVSTAKGLNLDPHVIAVAVANKVSSAAKPAAPAHALAPDNSAPAAPAHALAPDNNAVL